MQTQRRRPRRTAAAEAMIFLKKHGRMKRRPSATVNDDGRPPTRIRGVFTLKPIARSTPVVVVAPQQRHQQQQQESVEFFRAITGSPRAPILDDDTRSTTPRMDDGRLAAALARGEHAVTEATRACEAAVDAVETSTKDLYRILTSHREKRAVQMEKNRRRSLQEVSLLVPAVSHLKSAVCAEDLKICMKIVRVDEVTARMLLTSQQKLVGVSFAGRKISKEKKMQLRKLRNRISARGSRQRRDQVTTYAHSGLSYIQHIGKTAAFHAWLQRSSRRKPERS